MLFQNVKEMKDVLKTEKVEKNGTWIREQGKTVRNVSLNIYKQPKIRLWRRQTYQTQCQISLYYSSFQRVHV